MPRTLRRNVSPAVRARDAGVRRLHRLTVGAAIFGTAGTVVLGGAAAVNDPGRAVPTTAPLVQPGTAGTSSNATVPPATGSATAGSGQHHHHAAPPGAPGLVPPLVTGGQPGSGLITSGGS
jgi:hypothetical protein